MSARLVVAHLVGAALLFVAARQSIEFLRYEPPPPLRINLRRPNLARHCQLWRDSEGPVADLYLSKLRDVYGHGYNPCQGQDPELVALLTKTLPTVGSR